MKLKRYALAIQDYNQSLLLRPNHVNTLVERGIANFGANQYAAARLDFEAVIRVEPASAKALYGRGVLKLLSGDRSGDEDIAAARQKQANVAETMANEGVRP